MAKATAVTHKHDGFTDGVRLWLAGRDGPLVGRAPGLDDRGADEQRDGRGGEVGQLASCAVSVADAQPSAHGDRKGRPFERQLRHVGDELSAPAAQLDPDRECVGRDDGEYE